MFAFAFVVGVAPFGAAGADDQLGPNPIAACAAPFYATKVEGDPNVVVVRAIDLAGPLTGTITAYGVDTMWTAKIERTALTDKPYGGREASINVRAEKPIEGIAFTPSWAACTFHAGTLPRSGYEARDVERPTLTVANPQPVDPATCARPYAPTTVIRGFEPQTPAGGDAGTVRVAVALDASGIVRYARVVTASSSLNPSAVDAARRSEYSPAVFRCLRVPSGYHFTVQYVP